MTGHGAHTCHGLLCCHAHACARPGARCATTAAHMGVNTHVGTRVCCRPGGNRSAGHTRALSAAARQPATLTGHGAHADTRVQDTHAHTHTPEPLPTRAFGCSRPRLGGGGHSACAAGTCGDESRRAEAALSHRRRRGARPGDARAHACAHVTRAEKAGAWPFKGRGRASCPPPGGARCRRGSSAPSPGDAGSSPGPAASASGAGPGARRCHGNGAGGTGAVLGSPGGDLGSPRRAPTKGSLRAPAR